MNSDHVHDTRTTMGHVHDTKTTTMGHVHGTTATTMGHNHGGLLTTEHIHDNNMNMNHGSMNVM